MQKRGEPISSEGATVPYAGGREGTMKEGYGIPEHSWDADREIMRHNLRAKNPMASADELDGLEKQTIAKARELLTGELADKHTKLTDYLAENFGKNINFGDFKHLLRGIGIVAAAQQTKLWNNYSQKKGLTKALSGKK